MPIFEYSCKDCGKNFEELVLGGDDSDVVCPHCGSSKVGKLMSCCRGKMGGGKDMDAASSAKASAPASSGGGGCAGCSGGSCASCH